MRTFNYKVSDLERIYKANEGTFSTPHFIIDTMISNDISPEWIYSKGNVICFGVLHDESIKTYMAESEDDQEFKIFVTKELERIKQLAKPKSFNSEFESGTIFGTFNFDIETKEIRPFKGKGCSRDNFYSELIEKKKMPTVDCELKNDMAKIREAWVTYIKDKDERAFMQIVECNLNSLLKEVVIDKHRQYFLDTNEVNDRGWKK